MQSVKFEVVCPVCEMSSMAEPSNRDQELPCPECGYRFVWRAHDRLKDVDESSPWPSLLDRLPLPALIEEELLRRRNAQPPTAPPHPTASALSAPPAPLATRHSLSASEPSASALMATGDSTESESALVENAESLPDNTSEHLASIREPRWWNRVSPLWWITGLCLVACVAIIIATLVNGIQGPETADHDASSSTAGTPEEGQPNATPKVPVFESEILNETQLDSAWRKLSPYLMTVNLETTEGPASTNGLLVDTRVGSWYGQRH